MSKGSKLPLNESLLFLKNAALNPKQIAYVFPSTRWLIRAIADSSQLQSAKHIVELGPGTGGTTKGFLSQMTEDAELIAVDINKDFIAYLKKTISDKRLSPVLNGAQNLKEIIANKGWDHADIIISGIPFSTLPKTVAKEIMQSIYDNTKPGGLFVAYQFRDRVGQLATPLFGQATTCWVFKNFPPMQIFIWKKS